jgi:hypothetical protein
MVSEVSIVSVAGRLWKCLEAKGSVDVSVIKRGARRPRYATPSLLIQLSRQYEKYCVKEDILSFSSLS